jgi:hypothetical protein
MTETTGDDANLLDDPEQERPEGSVDPDAPARGVLDDDEPPEPNEPA